MKKGQRPKHQVVCILVEGNSEIRVLQQILFSLYDKINPFIEVFFPTIVEDNTPRCGDITSMKGVNAKTINGCIVKLFITPFLNKQKLYPKDLTEIIHIVDMDGAYIDDSSIIVGENPLGIDKVYYGEDRILTTNVENIKERNQRKRENIDVLCSQTGIKVETKTIPYSIYFFSSNLDHVLHNDANIVSGSEKVIKADKYASRFVDVPEAFVKSINDIPGTLHDLTYEETWDFIRQRNNNSLERHTNINLLFEKLLNEVQEEITK